jgi:hypothetical protein
MKQKLLIATGALLIVIAGLFVFLYNSIDSIVKNGIERFGTDVCGTRVTVGSVDISLKSGRGTIRDLRVANPDGFSRDSAVKFGETTIVVDINSLNRDPIVIQEIRVMAPAVNAEIDEKFATNVGNIRKHVEEYQTRSAQPASGKQDAGFEKHFVIRSFVVEKGVIKGDATRIGKDKQEFDMPPIELTDVGGSRGARPEALTKAISAALFARVTQVVSDNVKASATEKLKSKLGEILGK